MSKIYKELISDLKIILINNKNIKFKNMIKLMKLYKMTQYQL